MSDQASFGIRITANDQTARGAKAAEKRLGAIPKHTSAVNRRQAEADERNARRSSRGILRTFGQVEQATARAFGGRSVTAGVAERLGAIRAAGAAAGAGLGEAAASGGVLTTVMGGLGVVAGATVGILATAAFGAFKLADGWAKGAAGIGRLAELLGIGTRGLQEFTAAGERVGVDKATGTGALAGLTKTLNDARYGRNNEAVALMARLGLKMKTKSDGTADVEAMLPDIADKLKGQNSSGRRTAAAGLGISEAALVMFTQGGKALSNDMADAGKNAPMISDDDTTLGKRLARRHTMVRQKVDREVIDRAGRYAATGTDAAETWAIEQFRGTVTRDFAPGARTIDRAADRMERAAGRMERSSGGARATGRFTAGQISGLARRAIPIKEEARRYGFSEAEAAGIAANIVLESGGRHTAREGGGGSGRGLIQWTDRARKAKFRQIMGVDVESASRDQQWRFLRWETQNTEARNWKKALAGGQDPGSIAAGFARHVERPANKDRDSAERAAVADVIPVNVRVELVGAPAGTKVMVQAGKGQKPAVSHAMR